MILNTYYMIVLVLILIITVNGNSNSNNNYVSYSNSLNDNDNDNKNGEVSSSNSANIQYMITQRMRRVLEDELRYLPEEVDVMEPQIASVVIERNLSRPSNGMPASWRRTDPSDIPIGGKSINAFFKSIKLLTRKFADTFGLAAKKFFPAAIPIVIGYYLIPFVGDALSSGNGLNILKLLKLNIANPFKKTTRSFDSIDNDRKADRSKKLSFSSSHVDIGTLNQVTNLSPIDAAALNIKKKFKF